MPPLSRSLLLFCSLILALAPRAIASPSPHPLDPLSMKEHAAALRALQEAGKLTARSRFARLALRPPEKAGDWAKVSSASRMRQAEAVIKQGDKTFEAVIDIGAGRLVSWREIPGVQPPWLSDEYDSDLVDEVLQRKDVRDALKLRGINSAGEIGCTVNPHGGLGEARFAGRRVGIVVCQELGQAQDLAPREIDGLYILVDMNTRDILEVETAGVVPTPARAADYGVKSPARMRRFPAPIEVRQAAGPGFRLEGNSVTWDRWRFHVRSDQRVGLIVSTVTWTENGVARPVLYEGHLSEIFVPYMDPAPQWATRVHLDAGENSAGGLSDSLEPGVHCPANAVFMDAVIVEDDGQPLEKPRVICLFERFTGDAVWLHEKDGRQKRVLVARMSVLAGNYDYLIDWVFQTDGEIRLNVGATGILGVKTTAVENAVSGGPGADEAQRYGRFVDNHLIGVNHSHYFNFRLDLDVDGTANNLIIDRMQQISLPPGHPRRGVWVSQPAIVEREHDLAMHHDHAAHAMWRIASAAKRNAQGYPTSYQIMGGHYVAPMMPAEDAALGRAGFIRQQLWVTPRRADELYAAGDYPTQSQPGKGLPEWTAANRTIRGEDIVVWYTIGMHHVVRAEDWPVMPTLTHGISLRPFDFFDRNPALDVSREP